EDLLRRRPRWTINALHGRPVTALPGLVKNLRAVDQHPFRVVIELGSNQVPGWTKADYVAAIDQLPRGTRVLLVTPYKAAGGRWSRRGVETVGRYARWMQQIARTRPHTCVVPWRATASAHPEWLRDGLHPKADAYGQWADLILATDSACR
ncbi:GDSL-type esterase/lipase family protein, partial [Nocardioides sp. CER28]